MADLFEETRIKNMTLKNRFVRSATWTGLASADGGATDKLTALLAALAEGGVGLIITGHTFVSPEGRAAAVQMGIDTDGNVPSLRRMVARVHDAGGKIAIQLSHGGRHALKRPGLIRLASSTVESRGEVRCKGMMEEEIRRVAGQFADAARRAKEAGFDAVQIHAAHGYLLSEFLSPFYNKRTDAYGGPIENRARFLLETVDAVRREVKEEFPVLVKLNAQEFLEGGFTVEDMLETASLLEKTGVDAVEMSGGNQTGGVAGELSPARKGHPREGEGPYYLDEARRFKERTNLPLMLVGGFRSLAWSGRVLAEGIADYISLSRPLIREPGLVRRWMSGDVADSTCISDNGCFKPGIDGEGVYCVLEKRAGSGEG